MSVCKETCPTLPNVFICSKCRISEKHLKKLQPLWARAGTRTFSCGSYERYAIWIDPCCRWMNGLMDRRCWFLPTGVEGWKIRYLEMGIAKSMACIWASKERTSVGIMVGRRTSECSWSEGDLRLSSAVCFVRIDRAALSFVRLDLLRRVLRRRSNCTLDGTVLLMDGWMDVCFVFSVLV